MMRHNIPVVGLFRVCFFLLSLYRATAGQDYIIRNYSPSNGLVQTFVVDVITDPRGFLWIVTNEGISRYDGSEFINFRDSCEFFNTHPVRASIDSLGTIYIRNREDQIWKYDGKNFSKLKLPDGYPDFTIASIKIHGRKDLIVSTVANGLFILSDNKWKNYTVKDGLFSDSLTHVSEYFNGVTYIAGSGGICKYESGKISKVIQVHDLIINTIVPDKKGNLWITAIQNGIRIFNGKEIKVVYAPPGLIAANGYVDHNDNLWFATNYGFMRFEILNDDSIKRKTVISEPTTSINIDKDNNIWLGSYTNGIYKISENPFRSFTVADGLPANSVFPIREDKNGIIWAGTQLGLAKFDGERWKYVPLSDEVGNPFIRRMNKDNNNNLFIAVQNTVIKYDGKSFASIIPNDEIPYEINGYHEYKNGTKWIGTSQAGIWKNQSGHWEQLQLPDSDSNIRVMALYVDSKNSLWFCSRNNGLFRIRNGIVRQINMKNGLVSNSTIDITEDADGNLWVATLGGVSEIKDTSVIRSFTLEDGLTANTCYTVMCTDNLVFIGTVNGINIFDGTNFLKFSAADGLINSDINSTSLLKDDNGNIWVGTPGGISVFRIDDILKQIQSAVPFVKKISGRDASFTYSALGDEKQIVKFSPGDNDIRIDFIGIGFEYTQNIFFEYRLSGITEEWENIGSRKYVEFPVLLSGNYLFELRVKQFIENENRIKTSVVFAIAPYFYQTSWFKILTCSIIVVIVLTTIKIKRDREKKRNHSKYSTSSLNKDNYRKILEHVNQRMEKEKLYREPELTLKKLADEMNVPKEHLSEVINKEYKVNFNDHINKLRIDEAKKLLIKPGSKSTILEIALAVGFNSKSTFNSAFKRFTKTTPSEFRKQSDFYS